MDQRERAEAFRKRYQIEEEIEQEKYRMRQEKFRRKKRQIVIKRALIVSFTCIGAALLVLMVKSATTTTRTNGDDPIVISSRAEDESIDGAKKDSESVEQSTEVKQLDVTNIKYPNWIDQQFLTINEYSRPNIPIEKVNDIAIHYVGNPGTSAQQNRDYFESLATTKSTSASAHFIIGLDGEIIQAIPLNEKSYCTNHRNFDTISIEVCHPDAGGKFNEKTYQSLIKLVAWLMQQLDLDADHMIRHYDVTGKICPKYYVDNEDSWLQMKKDVKQYMQNNPTIQ